MNPPVAIRNVANSDCIKESIRDRSEKRSDDAQITAWLIKSFQRWILKSFEQSSPLVSLADFKTLTGEDPPDWLPARMEGPAEAPIVIINPEHPYLRQLEERCVEWLRSKLQTPLAAKFGRMTPDHVLKHWRRDHQRMARAQGKGLLETSGGALTSILRRKGAHVVEFDPTHPEFRKELSNESVQMGHCVGQFEDRKQLSGGYGEHYAGAAEKGDLRLFSLRDGAGNPHVTLSIFREASTSPWEIEQIKGKQNRPPVLKYSDAVKAALNTLDVEASMHPDSVAAAIYPQNGRFVSPAELEDEEDKLLAVLAHPELCHSLKTQSPALKWQIALSAPGGFAGLKSPDPLMAIAAVLQEPALAEELSDPDDLLSRASAGVVNGEIDGEVIGLNRF